MINLTLYPQEALAEHVLKDAYFYNERNDPDYLLALVKEEFHYTDNQLDHLLLALLEAPYTPACYTLINDSDYPVVYNIIELWR